MPLLLVLLLALLPLPALSQALGLDEAWRLAMDHDPTLQAAQAERDAGLTNRAQGRAAMLPQISASFGRNKNTGTLESPGPLGRGTTTTDLDYMSRTNQIQASQTLFNWARITEARQGYARADYSLALFDTKARDTSVRLVNRYLQALLSYQNVQLATSNLAADQKLITASERRYQAGEGTITDVREAQARRDMARAELIRNQDELAIAQRELQEMLGSAPTALVGLKPSFTPQPLQPATLDGWLAQAAQANADVRTSTQAQRIAGLEVQRAWGGHLPTVDIVASRRVVESETLSTRGTQSYTTTWGFQANLPIFSGGATHAQVEQARANSSRATHELAATREQVAVEVTRQYQGVVSGAQRIAALLTAQEASQQALHAVQKSYMAGTRSIVDILDAQDQLYIAQRDLIQARLLYVRARIMLDAAADTLDSQAITHAAQTWFGGTALRLD